ncbi:MAG TPA: DUF6340 family protein [Bacteroidales bacterium]|nr:DUF6340 family protein [Bacteroidales bacterium]
MKNYFIPLFAATITIVSCKTNELYINVMEPAPVTIPSYVKSIAVIDRSATTEEAKPLDVVDKVLTLEGANLDKDGAAESIAGLKEELMRNERFTEVKTLSNIEFKTPRLAVMPQPLAWNIVEQICSENKIDALFSLEKFDTDTRIGYSNRKVEIETPLGKIPGIEHQADMETLVKTGWRIYDPKAKAILDEFIYDESVVYHGRGINPVVAAAGLIGRKEAVKEVGNKAGHGYALRLIPIYTRVYRDYYVKGSDNFKIAKRKAQMGKWDEAADYWNKELDNPKMKIAGRAAYNMAIINEINGNLDEAIGWAQKSYEDYNNKMAARYFHLLEGRRYENQVLAEQGN